MVRQVNILSLRRFRRFNPRTRDGATNPLVFLSFFTYVSIHARVMVRHLQNSYTSGMESFNPRTRDGATNNLQRDKTGQSFNPRTRDGATSIWNRRLEMFPFQSTHA